MKPAIDGAVPWRVSSSTHVMVGQKMKRVPVRVQIAWAKAYKRLKNGENKQVVNTKRWKQDNVYNATVEEYTEIDYHNTKPPAGYQSLLIPNQFMFESEEASV